MVMVIVVAIAAVSGLAAALDVWLINASTRSSRFTRACSLRGLRPARDGRQHQLPGARCPAARVVNTAVPWSFIVTTLTAVVANVVARGDSAQACLSHHCQRVIREGAS